MRSTLLLLALSGCDWFRDAADTVDDVLDPIVAVGIVELVEAPAELPEGVDLPDELRSGTGATMFLADARDVGQLAEAPVAGATLVLSGCGDDVELDDGGDGSYTAVGVLQGCEGPFLVERTNVDPPSTLPIALPASQDPGVPPTWSAGEPLVLDLSGADWNGAVIVVVDVTHGDVTYTNEPDGIAGWYQLLEGQQDLGAVTIPGEAFVPDALHVVAVTGLLRTKKSQLENVNTLLSTVDGGRTTVHPLSTLAP